MKIVPVVTEKGVFYRVRKAGIFGKKYLSNNGRWMSPGSSAVNLCFFDPLNFDSVSAATAEIRKQFGKQALIDLWEG